MDKRPEKLGGEEKEGEADAESDGGSSGSSADDADEPKLHRKSLFSIDVASGLGQRVLKHMTAEIHVPVIADAEQFCRTPIKDKYHDRLRTRQLNYPVTWKLTHKRMRQQAHCHLYKCTRAQKFEFMEKMRTGLNWRCRKLLGSVKKCSVVVKRLSMKTLYKWKPSLNKITVPLTPLSSKEIQYWTRPKRMAPQPSVFPDGPTFLLNDIDRVLGLKRKDGNPEVASKLLAGHFVSETANAELQLQKLTVYRSLLADLSSSVATERVQHLETVSSRAATRRRGLSEKGKTYPTLFSILSGSPAAFKVPCERKETATSASVDVKKPLKIDIPSPSAGHLPSLTRSDRSSPLDDSFSIMTVSSDEDNNKSAACCSLCTVRNKCRCTAEKTASAATSRSSQSSALAFNKVSPHSLGSPIPPTLASPSGTPKTSFSPQPTPSPPYLSPVSLGPESCPQSPASSRRLLTRSSTVSPKPSAAASPLRPPPVYRPESPLARRPRSKSPSTHSPGKVSEYSRNGRDTSERGLKGAAPRVSKSKDTLLAVQRPNTRSSSRESAASEPAEVPLLRKGASAPSDARNGTRKASPGSRSYASLNTASKIETDLVASKAESRLTRSSTHTGSAPETSVLDVNRNSRQPRNGQSCRSSSNSSDRIEKVEERKNNSGQSSRSNSNSSDRNQRTLSVTKRTAASHGVSRTLRSGHPVGKLQPEADTFASISSTSAVENAYNKNMNSVHTKSASSSPNTRRSARGNPFVTTGDGKKVENGVEPVQHRGVKRGATEATAAQSRTQNGGVGTGPSKATAANPFLISKAQTQLFSSNILEQARRHWNQSHRSPSRDGSVKGVLRSGNTYRMSNIALGSPVKSFGSETRQADSAALPISPSGFGAQRKIVADSKTPVLGPGSPGSPGQRVPLLHTRMRLSPMQMMSVLESAKATSSSSKVKSLLMSPAKKNTNQKRLDRGFSRVTGRKLGYQYHTRAKESTSLGKKARFAD